MIIDPGVSNYFAPVGSSDIFEEQIHGEIKSSQVVPPLAPAYDFLLMEDQESN